MRSGQPPQQKGFLRVRPKGGNLLVIRLEQRIAPGREQNLLLSRQARDRLLQPLLGEKFAWSWIR